MKNWKKLLLGTLAATAVSASLAVFAACQTDSGVKNNFVVDETKTLTLTGEAGTSVEFPEVSKEGYIFKGWYTNADFIGMPVTSATYGSETTYYAKWAKGYEVIFDLGGGTLDTSAKLYVEEGAPISSAVQNLIPTYGEYQFGGWYLGDEPLAANERMTTAGVTLTARYKAEYTVDVYLQSIDENDVYVKSESYATGYALIGEDFEPEVTVSGFTVTSHENELTEKEISGTKSQNVFRIYFDRNSYTLTLSANYPDGSFDSINSTHVYEKEFTLPENTFIANGCRFIGWALSPNAGYDDIIKDSTYALTGDEVLYAIWNIGYVDMFSGADRIFVDPADSTKITLNRGGIDIEGTYDEIREVYTLRSTTDTTFKITVKLRDDGKFVYLSSRQGSYVLYTEQGTINKNVRMIFDDYDGCEYNSVGTFTKSGSYTVDDNGHYVATVIDQVSGEESTVHFIVGLAYDSSGVLTRVFKVRGEEYYYGGVPGYVSGRFIYPVLTFDGYGTVNVEMPNNQRADYSYTINSGVLSVYSTQNMQQVTELVARFDNINGQYVYKYYDSSLDKEYKNANNSDISIKLDGCNAIVYTDGDRSYTGTYADVVSLNNGCHIIAATEENGTVHTYLLNGIVFIEEANVSGVYFFYDDSSRLRTPILAIKASDDDTTAEAVIFDIDGSNFWGVVSRGIITRNENSFTYRVTGDIASWSNDKYSEMTLVIGGVSASGGSYPVYFLLSATERGENGEENAVKLSTLYVGADGSKLTLTEAFAVYEIAGSSNALLGSYTNGSGYITVTAGGNSYYFVLNEATEEGADNTFEQLENQPLTMYWLMGGTVVNAYVTLTLTGRNIDGNEEAIYDASTSKFVGVIETETVNVLDGEIEVYRFTGINGENGQDETFYFTIITHSLYGYCFNQYKDTSSMILGSFFGVDEDGNPNDNEIRITADNKFTFNGSDIKNIKGTWTSEDVYVFGIIPVTVYTFIPDNETNASFKFTLRYTSSSTYFLIEGESAFLTAADGSTVEFDGVSHVAQYTDKDGVQYENYYWTAVNVLDSSKAAYMMIINGEYLFFDADGETFALRGWEQDSYFVIKNSSLTLEQLVFEFDGYGGVKAILNLSTDEEQTITGSYTSNNGVYTVTLENGKTYTGYLGNYTMVVDSKYLTVSAFYIEIEGYSGNYLNEADLSVLVLDSIGNAIKYSSYGVREIGGYVVLDDGLIYYINTTSTSAAVYAIEGNTVKVENNSSTYYADDMSAAVFTTAGNLVFGSGDAVLYVFNEDKSRFTTYVRDSENVDANEYGFVTTEYSITDGKFVYGEKVYKYFDGMPITLTSSNGSTLMFTPSGSVTFSSAATYTPVGGEAENCYIITWYNSDGELIVTLSREEAKLNINGSTQEFNFTYEYQLSVNLSTLSFELSDTDLTIGLIAYDYDYITDNGMSESCLFIWAEEVDGEYTFTVDGYFTSTSGTRLRFNDGVLSKAGGVPSQGNGYSNMFVCEFVGSDNYTYHLYFMLLPFGNSYTFVACPLVRVTAMQEIDEEGTVYYAEAFVYGSSLLDFEGYTSNSDYLPTLKYKGEIICTSGWSFDESKDEWRFISYEYKGNEQIRSLYVLNVLFDEDDEFESATVAKYELKSYKTANNSYTVYVWQNDEEIFEVYAIGQSSLSYVRECVKNEDGSFDIATVQGLYYRIMIVVEGENVTVTVERREAPAQPGGGEEELASEENLAA